MNQDAQITVAVGLAVCLIALGVGVCVALSDKKEHDMAKLGLVPCWKATPNGSMDRSWCKP